MGNVNKTSQNENEIIAIGNKNLLGHPNQMHPLS
jgi:hypothetical protein